MATVASRYEPALPPLDFTAMTPNMPSTMIGAMYASPNMTTPRRPRLFCRADSYVADSLASVVISSSRLPSVWVYASGVDRQIDHRIVRGHLRPHAVEALGAFVPDAADVVEIDFEGQQAGICGR